MVSAGGRLGLVENVTEEVQSLRNRVELLEKVREKHTRMFKPKYTHRGKKATYADTSQPRSPGALLILV